MNDMISGMTQNQNEQIAASDAAYVDYRLRAIATNALREARIAYGRDGGQWIDDDIRRVELIFHYLHITPAESIIVSNESYPLVSSHQAPKDALLDEAEQIVRKRRGRVAKTVTASSLAHAAIEAELAKDQIA